MAEIILRPADEKDIPAIIDLYQGTVRSVNSLDYTPEQTSVWASGAENLKRWSDAIKEQYFVIAEIINTPLPQSSLPSREGNWKRIVAGFSSIRKDGYLDFLYVHKDCQRKGVGSALLIEIERKAVEQKNPEIYSHASSTAKGLFERMGYIHKEDIRDIYKGVLFVNALMLKKLK